MTGTDRYGPGVRRPLLGDERAERARLGARAIAGAGPAGETEPAR